MTSQADIRIVELLCSRLCHDLISPVGAINNGVELIDELGPEMVEEATRLIGQSGRRAAARLRYFRLAYGAAGGRPAGGGLDEVRAVAADYLDGGKVALEWRPPAWLEEALPVPTARLILGALALGDEALVHGGTLSLEPLPGAAPPVVAVAAEGRTARLGDEIAAALAGTAPLDDLTPRTILAYLTGCQARQQGGALVPEQQGPGRLVLRLDFGTG